MNKEKNDIWCLETQKIRTIRSKSETTELLKGADRNKKASG